jgi:hypothetical protein
MTLSAPSSGYQQVAIDLGVRNDASFPWRIEFPGNQQSMLTSSDGRTYDFSLDFVNPQHPDTYPFIMNRDNPTHEDFASFAAPPGFVFCGINDSVAGIRTLTATGQIPQQTTPTTLEIPGYPPLDLTSQATPSACTPKLSSTLPHVPASVYIGNPVGPTNGNIYLGSVESVGNLSTINSNGPAIIVHVSVQNYDGVNSFTTPDLYIWAIGSDGIVRDLIRNSPGMPNCPGDPVNYNVGVGQIVDGLYCIRTHSRAILMLVFQDDDYNDYWMIGL